MSSRVYRLQVTYPEGSLERGWEPPGWRDGLAAELGRGELDDGSGYGRDWQYDFRWPRRRTYLARAGAEKQAEILRRCGAAVEVQCSEPVTWAGPLGEVARDA